MPGAVSSVIVFSAGQSCLINIWSKYGDMLLVKYREYT
jgi:hypothetical protein